MSGGVQREHKTFGCHIAQNYTIILVDFYDSDSKSCFVTIETASPKGSNMKITSQHHSHNHAILVQTYVHKHCTSTPTRTCIIYTRFDQK